MDLDRRSHAGAPRRCGRRRSVVHVAVALLATATMISGSARAAKEIGLGATYDPRVPLGDFRDFADAVAFAGFQARWDYFLFDRLSAGVDLQYHLFQRETEVETSPVANGAITASTFRYASILSAVPTVRYYFSSGALRPFVAVGVGGATTTSAILVSDVTERDNRGALILQPSAGVLLRLSKRPEPEERPTGYTREPLDSMFGLIASVTYAFTTADLVGGSDGVAALAGIQIGLYAKRP